MRANWVSLGLSVLMTLSTMPLVATPVAAANSSSDVIEQINTIRLQNGLPALASVPQLSASAQAYATAMASGKFFAHVGPDGSTMISRDTAAILARPASVRPQRDADNLNLYLQVYRSLGIT